MYINGITFTVHNLDRRETDLKTGWLRSECQKIFPLFLKFTLHNLIIQIIALSWFVRKNFLSYRTWHSRLVPQLFSLTFSSFLFSSWLWVSRWRQGYVRTSTLLKGVCKINRLREIRRDRILTRYGCRSFLKIFQVSRTGTKYLNSFI